MLYEVGLERKVGNHGPALTVQTSMRNIHLVVALAAVALLGAGCLGSSAALAPATHVHHTNPPSYAHFIVRGTYANDARTANFGSELRHAHFTINCASLKAYRQLRGILSWDGRECIAILDFQTAPRDAGLVCPCPLTVLSVDVRGTIQGRPVHDRFSTCMCGFGKRGSHDAHVILTTTPPPAAT
jgi:hypothetical protein